MAKVSIKKKRKAVSPIVATLILIFIAVAAGVGLYAFTQINQAPPKLSVATATGDWLYGDVGQISLVVRNDGGKPATIQSITITSPTGISVRLLAPTTTGYSTDTVTGLTVAVPGNGQVMLSIGVNGTGIMQGARVSGEIQAVDPDTGNTITAQFSTTLQ